MALIKHRPRIKLLTAPQLVPGAPFDVTLQIEARRPVPVETIDLDLDGVEQRHVGRGQYQTSQIRQICRARARVSGETELQAGIKTYRARFQLADSAPPTYAGQHIKVAYVMHVRVAIPWWPDARASFELNVGHDPERALPAPRPLLFSSRPEGPNANEPHVEGSLSADIVAAGGFASGAVALNNVAYARYAGLRLALIGVEHVNVNGRSATTEAHRYEMYLPVDQPSEGEQRQFQMRLPHHVPASYQGPLWRLSWQFECKAEIRWGQDLVLRVPITVLPWTLKERTSGQRRAPPTVGSERVQAIWRAVAEAHGLAFDGSRIHGRAAGCEVTIEREHRGRRGLFLLGRLGFDNLHLDVQIEPERRRFRAGRKGVQLGNRRWDRDHVVLCRDAPQLEAMAAHLRPGLMHFKAVRMTDDSLVTELHNAGVSKSRLEGFASGLLAAARAIQRARTEIPPPALMRPALPAWTELAGQLDGALETARMAIAGTLMGLPARVTTEWSPSGEPLRTTLSIAAPMTLDHIYRGRYAGTEGPHLADSDLLTVDQLCGRLAGDDADAEAPFWVDGAWLVDISAESLEVGLPAPLTDVDELLRRLRGMADWVRQASGAAGPYR